MARDIFGDVVTPSISIGSRRWYTLPVSIVAHVAVIGGLIVVPLMASDVLPSVPGMMNAFVAPSPPPAPPPPPRQTPAAKPIVDVSSSAAPLEAPPEITKENGIVEEPRAAVTTDLTGVVGSFPGTIQEAPPPLPPPPAPVRVGGNIRPPAKVKDQSPVYPPIAQSARVQGVVILEATIGQDGRVQDVKLLRSIPLLDAAAIDAVRQWTYTPTLLNGVPVPVIMTITVNFSLR